jgi:alkylhydroperoxidase family enzyme
VHDPQALGVEVGYLYEGLAARGEVAAPSDPRRRVALQLTRDVAATPSRAHREAVYARARVMAEGAPDEGR